MLLLESIETLNKRLVDHFGKFENGQPNWRIVWAEDQVEKQITKESTGGIQLLFPEVREVKKYGYIKNKYILEQITPVPVGTTLTEKLSYECLWTFQDINQNPVAPKWEAIYILITTLQYQMELASKPYALYKEPMEESNSEEGIAYRANKLHELLYGNETSISDSLAMDTAVGFGERKRNDWKN